MKQPVSDFQQCRSAIAQHGQNIEAFIKTVLADIKTANAELGLFEYIDEATVLSDAARLDALPQEQREGLTFGGPAFCRKRHHRCRRHAYRVWLCRANRLQRTNRCQHCQTA
jgi:hypothetical protein